MENKMNDIIRVFFEPHGIKDNIIMLRAKLYCLECTKNCASIDTVKNSFGYRISKEYLPKEVLSDEYIERIINYA